MAIFKAFSDESGVGNPRGTFLMGGFVALEKDWPDFEAAWQERVLDGPPKLPYLHMTEIRSFRWRHKHGISYNAAEERVSEAVRVIYSSGSLSAVGSHVRRDDLEETIKDSLRAAGVRFPALLNEPDYLCFLAYALFVLDQVCMRYPDVEKVDFIVSRKNKVTNRLTDFHKALKMQIGPPLDALVGDLVPGDMDRQLPLQAADLLCWHMQRYFAKTMDRIDEGRLWCLGESSGILHEVTRKDLAQIARTFVIGDSD